MTSTDLRALIAGAEELPPYTVSPTARPEQSLLVRGDSYLASTQLPTGVANLIAGVANNAEKFAELLAAEEAKSTVQWMRGGAIGHQKAWVGRLIKGWIFPSMTGQCWCGNTVDGELTEYPTEAEARAAVEAAVRAGR